MDNVFAFSNQLLFWVQKRMRLFLDFQTIVNSLILNMIADAIRTVDSILFLFNIIYMYFLSTIHQVLYGFNTKFFVWIIVIAFVFFFFFGGGIIFPLLLIFNLLYLYNERNLSLNKKYIYMHQILLWDL